MSIEVEDLLRRTYADVAERTAVTAPGDAVLVPLAGRSRASRLRPYLAAAAVLTLVVSGLAAIRRSTEQAGAVDASTFVHALPGYLPSAESFGPPFVALRAIRSDGVPETVDQLEYAGGGVELVIRTVVTSAPLPAEPNTALANGTPAWIDAAATELVWNPHDGFEISVRLIGSDETTLRAVADQMVTVDDEAWVLATEHAGFVRMQSSTDEPRPGLVATYEIPAVVPFRAGIVGRLHDGFRLDFGQGAGLGFDAGLLAGCRASASLLHDGGGGPSTVLVLSDRPQTVEVRVDGAEPVRVEVEHEIPGTAYVAQTFETDVPAAASLSWTCEEVAP